MTRRVDACFCCLLFGVNHTAVGTTRLVKNTMIINHLLAHSIGFPEGYKYDSAKIQHWSMLRGFSADAAGAPGTGLLTVVQTNTGGICRPPSSFGVHMRNASS